MASPDLLPLVSADTLDDCIAHYRGRSISVAQFIADADGFSRSLPASPYAINLADNRYHFLLGWIAACLRNQVTLLPSAQAAGVLEDLARGYPDRHVVDDDVVARFLERPQVQPARVIPLHWRVEATKVVAIAFTSGTTAAPQPHPKTWRGLVRNSQLAAQEVLGGRRMNVVATVPPQHMYGLENSLVCALSAQCRLFDGKPFFPADVRAALESVPAPRTLVTTPAHLKILVEAGIGLPPLQRIVSATAALAIDLAARVEQAWGAPVMEIYGCTEAGVMAHRRTTQTERWQAFDGSSVVTLDGVATYRAPQLPEPIPLQDIIESYSDTEFALRGRAGDMIKVAGKRASLQDITRQILAVPGVVDAVVFAPRPDARPAALVVAPGIDATRILATLRERIEQVFVPRPLIVVDQLPRNAVGKLPHATLLQLLDQHRSA